jgi:hypothetical protein
MVSAASLSVPSLAGVAQFLTDPAAGVAAFEVGAVLGGVLGAVWRAGASR